jgi:hypothetical protein
MDACSDLPGLDETNFHVLKIARQDRGYSLAVTVAVAVLLTVAALDVVPLLGSEPPSMIDDGGRWEQTSGCDLSDGAHTARFEAPAFRDEHDALAPVRGPDLPGPGGGDGGAVPVLLRQPVGEGEVDAVAPGGVT